MPRTPLLEYRAGQAGGFSCCATQLGAEMVAMSVAGNGQAHVPFAGRPTGSIGDVLPVGEIVRRSLLQAEDALVRLQAYRALRCGPAEVSNARQT